jgi:hypothetical protein
MIYTAAHLANHLLARGATIKTNQDSTVLTATHGDDIVVAIFDNQSNRFRTGAAARIEDGHIFSPRRAATLKAVVDALNLPAAA